MKNKWEKPQLIVLSRNKPEEKVLDWCKGSGITYDVSFRGSCSVMGATDQNCNSCRGMGNS